MWIKTYIRFHELRHPRDMGQAEVEQFLSYLANARRVSASTHKQALAALLFLYKRVLDIELPWMQEIGRPRTPHRLPVVLSRDEVCRLLRAAAGVYQLVFRLLYGTGMRKLECLQLRVKDLDLERRQIIIREGKGNKDRITVLPSTLEGPLRRQLEYAESLWTVDRQLGRPGVAPLFPYNTDIPARVKAGRGSGCSRPTTSLSTRKAECVVDITCMRERWERQSNGQQPGPGLASRSEPIR